MRVPAPRFRMEDYPPQMVPFVESFLDQFDYNSKASTVSPHVLWGRVCDALLSCGFKQPCELKRVADLPEDQQLMLIKCLGHRVGVWDMHVYYALPKRSKKRTTKA